MKKYVLTLLLFLGVITLGFSQSPVWNWQYPLPTANGLSDVFFINAQTGWAVGGHGTILKTTTGGNHWEVKPSGTIQGLSAVYFLNSTTGWAIGNAMLKTTDGGNTWQTLIPVVNEINVHLSVFFIDEQTGWLAGGNGMIRKTTDGGTTWQDQNSGLIASMDLYSIQFIDSQNGWAAGNKGKIVKTTNGGASWQIMNSGTINYLSTINFINATTGWATGDQGRVLKTTDGGTTWTIQTTGTLTWLRCATFSDELHGWASGWGANPSIQIATSDGGITWQTQSTIGANAIHFTDNHNGWAVGGPGMIMRTKNGGATWHAQSDNVSYISAGRFIGIDFVDDKSAWVVGEAGLLYKTNNNGRTWQSQTSVTTNDLHSVHFLNKNSGLIVGAGGKIFKTTSAGTTWQSMPSGTFNRLLSVQIVNAQNAWAVGESGRILKSTNGGTNWLWQTSGTIRNLNSIHLLDAQTGWIAGDSGVILKTINGGTNWLAQTTGTVNPLNDVCFINAQTGWAVGDMSTIRKTTDGGATWQAQSGGPGQRALKTVHFFNAQNGWIFGYSGTILKTSDGGSTWQEIPSGTGLELIGADFTDPDNGWVVGTNRTILTTYTFTGLDPDPASSLVTGNVIQHSGTNCNPNPSAPKLPGIVLKAMPGPYFSLSNSNGDYNLRLPVNNHAASTFSLSALPVVGPAFHATPACPTGNVYNLTVDSIPDTLGGKDFSMDVSQCHHLEVEIGSLRLRRCRQNLTYVQYINQGSLPAPGAYINVSFPQWVQPVSTTQPHTVLNDSTWRFDLGTVPPGGSGYFNILDTVLCDAPLNEMQCMFADIYPAPDCPSSAGWNGAEVSVSGVCDNGVVHLGVYNIGTGAMTDSVGYSVFMDSIQVRTGKVKLAAGDSLKLDVNAFGMSVTLSAIQVLNHPLMAFVSTTVEACDDSVNLKPKPTVNHFPKSVVANSKSFCLPIFDSYDPNDKQVFPIGFTANHVVKPGTKLEYLIRFQNTGNDTAYVVNVIDSLDRNLTVESLELGAVSHPYEVMLQTTSSGRNVLRFAFNHINLPDSNTNELMSHGFIQYRISPKAGLPLGSKVHNEADIYFDFNAPVLTNRTVTTFDNLVFTNPGMGDSVHMVVPTQTAFSLKQLGVKLYPNPVTQNQLTVSFSSKGSISLFNAQGQLVYRKENLEGVQMLPLSLRSGVYFAHISTPKGSSVEKLVLME